MTIPVLEIEGVSKRFGTNLANDDISLTLAKGEIVALLGENGAGKTTLMSILFGHYMPDAGRILIDGAELPQGKPRAAIRAGVGMVHQHFSLAPNLTVLENVMTGTEKLWSWRSGTSAARKKLLAISERFGLKVDPDARLGDLSVGEQQRVEILKALYSDARILILDEPTAVLTNIEAEKLFTTLKEMARQGLSLIFISHKLDEVMAAADRIVVLRSGKMVAERRASETSKAELAELMVGRRVTRPVREPSTPGTVALEATDVTVKIDGVERLKSVRIPSARRRNPRDHRCLGQWPGGAGASSLRHALALIRRPPAFRGTYRQSRRRRCRQCRHWPHSGRPQRGRRDRRNGDLGKYRAGAHFFAGVFATWICEPQGRHGLCQGDH